MNKETAELRMEEFNKNLANAVALGKEVSHNIQKHLLAKGFTVEVNGVIDRNGQQNIWITRPSASETWKERVRLWLENPYGGTRFELQVELFPCDGNRGRTRKFKNHTEANIKKMVKDMFDRINEYVASIERGMAAELERAAWAKLRQKTLQGMIVPPCARVQIIQHVDQDGGLPKEGHIPEFALEFSNYGTTSLKSLRFSREQLALIFEGFAKALKLDTSWTIRFTTEPDANGRSERQYHTGSWVTKFINEAMVYATEEEAKTKAASLPSGLKERAVVCRYADEFLTDPEGKLRDAQIRS